MDNFQDGRTKGWFWDTNKVFGSGLSSRAIVVRLYLARCADDKGKCFPSVSAIAKNCGIGRSSVFNALNELEEKGWLRRTARLNRVTNSLTSNIYTLIVPGEESATLEEPNQQDDLVHQMDGGSPPDGLGWSTTRTRVVHQMDGEQYPINNTQLTIPNEEDMSSSDDCAEVVNYFNETWKDIYPRGFTLTSKRKKQIKDRLKTFSLDTIKLAIDNLHQSPFHTGNNDRHWRANIDFLIRNDEQIDTWANNPPMGGPPTGPDGDDPYAEIYT